jgi:hypothetical protein
MKPHLLIWARDLGGAGIRGGGTEFPTEAALQAYLRQHPKADASKHTVAQKESTEHKEREEPKETPKASTKSSTTASKHGEPVVKTPQQLAAELPPAPEGKEQRYMGYPLSKILKVHEFPGSTELKAVIHRIDRNGREVKTYKYTEEHEQKAAARKFARTARMAKAMPELLSKVNNDLKSSDPHVRNAATAVALIAETSMRIGGSEHEKRTGSRGATTLRVENVTQQPDGTMRLQFKGKSGKIWDRPVRDPALVQALQEAVRNKQPGDRLLNTTAEDVNDYLRKSSPVKITAKDFRTHRGSAVALRELERMGTPRTMAEAKRNVNAAVKAAAAELNNTPAVCRKKYINPAIIDNYMQSVRAA